MLGTQKWAAESRHSWPIGSYTPIWTSSTLWPSTNSPIRGLDDKGDTMTPCYGINAREIARPLRSGHSDGSALETWRKSDAESGANDPIGRPGTP